MSPLDIEAVLKLVKSGEIYNDDINLKDIRVSKKLGGTRDDTKIVDGILFPDNKISKAVGEPTKIENQKLA